MTPHLRNWRRCAATILLCTLVLFSVVLPAAAQGIIIEPPDAPRAGLPAAVAVESYRVQATVAGPVATVRVTQVFRNDSDRTQEATYIFPLPAGATIGDFQMTVDGRTVEGKLFTKEEARRIYEEIVRRQRDPALLEYVGRDLFQTSVFPIPAHSRRSVELTYREVISLQNGLRRFVVPLGGGQALGQAESVAIQVELSGQPGLRTLYSPSHQVAIEQMGNDAARIGFESSDPAQQRDFILYWGSDDAAVGVNLLSYKPAGEDGFLLLLAAPGVEVDRSAVVERDIVLVLDVSGSMEGQKLAQAQDAARFVVDHLNEGDRFNLVSFSTGVDRWKGRLQAFDDDSRASAHRWIDRLRASGSTDINRALLESLALLDNPSDAARPAYVLFLTDGLPTQGEEDPSQIVANAGRSAPAGRTLRLFTFGVGYDVNTDLLDEVSADLDGRSSYVRPDEQIDEAVRSFYAGVSTPVLANLLLSITGANGVALDVSDSYPFPLPDLFAGGQLVWVGRYRTGGPVDVTLSGDVNGTPQRFRYVGQELVESGGEPAVARLWATRKIGALLTAVRRNGADKETIDAIIDLSLAYGIVTPYTSSLVEEAETSAGRAPLVWSGSVSPADAAPRSQAYQAAPAAIAQSAAAAASGEAAVRASEARSRLLEAKVAPMDGRMRTVAGKSFVYKGEVQAADGALYPLWVDTALEAGMTPRPIVFGSAAYFALAADVPVAQWLSLSPAMVLVIDGEAVQIILDGVSDSAPAVQPTPSVPEPPDTRPFWRRLLDVILGQD